MAKRKKLKPQVTIAYRCEDCGKIFARVHPKDPQIYCERCRRNHDTVHSKNNTSRG